MPRKIQTDPDSPIAAGEDAPGAETLGEVQSEPMPAPKRRRSRRSVAAEEHDEQLAQGGGEDRAPDEEPILAVEAGDEDTAEAAEAVDHAADDTGNPNSVTIELDAESAPAVLEAVAEAFADGMQPPLPAMPPSPELWPAVEVSGKRHKISRIRLGVSGALELFAGRAGDIDLASRLTYGREFGITIRGRVDETGHKVERANGVLVGLMGVAKFKAIEVIDEEQYYEQLYDLEDRLVAGMEALVELITDMREAGRRDADPVDPRIFARAAVQSLLHVERVFNMGPAADDVADDEAEASRKRRPTFLEFLASTAQEPPLDLEAMCVCGHARKTHDAAGTEPCAAIRVIELGDGTSARNPCACHAFRLATVPLEPICANCGHEEHTDDRPGCEVMVMRQQMNFERDLVDVPMPCECRAWQPRAAAAPAEEEVDYERLTALGLDVRADREEVYDEETLTGVSVYSDRGREIIAAAIASAEGGGVVTGIELDDGVVMVAHGDRELSKDDVAALAAVGRAAVEHVRALDDAPAPSSLRERLRPVASPDRQCGKMHRGHLTPCPYDAFECDLPDAEPAEIGEGESS